MKVGIIKSHLGFDGTAPLLAGILAVGLSAVMVAVDWGTWVELDVSIVYSVPLIVSALSRKSALVWALAVCLVVATFTVYWVQVPRGAFAHFEPFFLNRILSALTLVMTAVLIHVWMRAVNAVAAQSRSLAEQNEALDRLRQVADRANDRKSELLAAVSHDIGSPLSVINLDSTLILEAADKPQFAGKIPEMAHRIQSNAHSLMALRFALVDIAALDSGQTVLSKREFSLNDLLEEEAQRLLPLARAKNLRFVVDAPNPPVWLLTDRLKLSRVLTNLVTNAIKYTEQGSVCLSARAAQDGPIKIRVSDTGIGMAAADMQRIFDEYGQLGNPERDSNKGWGLGLTICRRLMSAMGGSLTVESEPNRGTIFTVHLPCSCMVNAVRVAPDAGRAAVTS